MQSLFEFIIYPMELGLIWLAHTVGSAGIGIILFTVFVRLVLAPLQIVQLRNAKAMQRIQPLVAELRQKHGSDKQALSQATMELYREHQVNPAMGCLPTLLQFPVLIGLFYALLHLGDAPNGYPKAIVWAKTFCQGHPVHAWSQWFSQCYAVKNAAGTPDQIWHLFHANFLWLSHGLGRPDPLYILPILAGVTQWIQSRMMLTKSSDPQQQMMNQMMNFMPLMIVVFATNYASGLSLYWVTSTLIGIAIQYRITGWGMLPILGNPGGSAGGSGRSPARPAPTRPKTSPPKKERPAQSAEPELRTLPTSDTQLNGQDGKGDRSEEMTAAARPRRRANRARGGRGGGRRG